ncbi:hypothetical protein ACRALDRAFT_1062116 [Sodiomyces alcalophilus JCM 7366]|uniref:uncharacterized protein n=1 Tax=Sodiomyces alcalophilus JCM 7366 TaxID=591952 RepID=UPI0039B43039
MASSDVRDVLNLETHAGPRPAKKQRTSAPRPNLKGLAREVQNLGGDNPIAIVPEASIFKKRRIASRKPAAKWELREFQNSARGDGGALVLKHWRRKTDAPGGGAPLAGNGASATETLEGGRFKTEESKPALEDSAFASFNVRVDVPEYSDDQYQNSLSNPDWTKDETDYLLSLVKDYDLRWPIIWDRYDYVPEAINGESSADGDESKAIIPVPKPRSVEDLKARYYEIASKMMAAQTPVQYMTKEEFALHETMAKFNPAQERLRKEFAINGMSRTKEEANEEESLLVEIKRILQRSAVFNEERRELYNRLDYPHTDQDISSFKSSAGLQTLLQTMMAVDKNKKRRSLMGADGASPAPGQSATGSGASSRRESVAAATTSGSRDRNSAATAASTPAERPSNRKAQQQQQQQQERRKLSEAEKYIYGVTYHDRLPPGPTFRYERINKLFTSKSGQQQIRISNLLTELDIPPRLTMPTAAVTAQFEQLMGAVNSLLDARKVTDKIDAEIKVEMAKKTEREERERKKNPPPEAAAESTKDVGAKGAGSASSNEEKNESDKEVKATAKQPDANDAEGSNRTRSQHNLKGEDTGASGERPASDDKTQAEKAGGREASGASHKRSASVLSTVSDKSTKRQKK